MKQESIYNQAVVQNPYSMVNEPQVAGAFHEGFQKGGEWVLSVMQRKVDQEREDGELLAYNCEKKGRRETLEVVREVLLEKCNPYKLSISCIEEICNAVKSKMDKPLNK